MGAQMYQEGWYQRSRCSRSYEGCIRIAGSSSHCARLRIDLRPSLHSWPTRPTHFGKAAVSVYVFTGPTISSAEASRVLEAVYLPPASEGDVYLVALKRPQ